MKNVHYIKRKPNFVRTLRPVDLASLGIQTKETLVWSADNNFCLTLNNKLSESLVDKLPSEFKLTDAPDDEFEAPEVIDPLVTLQSPQAVVNDSEGEQNDDDESSTLDDEEES